MVSVFIFRLLLLAFFVFPVAVNLRAVFPLVTVIVPLWGGFLAGGALGPVGFPERVGRRASVSRAAVIPLPGAPLVLHGAGFSAVLLPLPGARGLVAVGVVVSPPIVVRVGSVVVVAVVVGAPRGAVVLSGVKELPVPVALGIPVLVAPFVGREAVPVRVMVVSVVSPVPVMIPVGLAAWTPVPVVSPAVSAVVRVHSVSVASRLPVVASGTRFGIFSSRFSFGLRRRTVCSLAAVLVVAVLLRGCRQPAAALRADLLGGRRSRLCVCSGGGLGGRRRRADGVVGGRGFRQRNSPCISGLEALAFVSSRLEVLERTGLGGRNFCLFTGNRRIEGISASFI